ncbi:hypothetical protein OMR07_28700 [Methylobacterium organophilum]|nr:hypothetical protein [Methylobacterium organophilum]
MDSIGTRSGGTARASAVRAASAERRRDVEDADAAGDYDVANVTVGEAVGLIDDLPGAGDLVGRIAEEAEAAIRRVSAIAAPAP